VIQLGAPLPRPKGTLATGGGGRQLAELSERLRMPIRLVVAAIVLTVVDTIYTRATGELFTIVSLRPVWVTAPLALVGVGLAAWRLLDVL
jgi:hypothetical protein